MQIHQLVDAILFAFSFWLAFALRTDVAVVKLINLIPFFELVPVERPFSEYVWLYLLLIPGAPLLLEARGLYSRPIFASRRRTAWMLFLSCGLITLGLIFALFLFRSDSPRLIMIWFGVISLGLMLVKEEALRLIIRSQFAKAHFRRRYLLVGTPQETQAMRSELREHSQEETEVMLELNLDKISVSHLTEMLHEHSINGVIVVPKHANFQQVESVIHACELEGVEVYLISDFFRPQISRTSFDEFYGRPVLVFSTAPNASWQVVSKQILDFSLALVMLVALFPLFLLIALLIKITSPGPVLFKQQRSGLNGRPFTLYKFRTMVTNADQLKHELAAMNEMSGPVFKITNDPRITGIGKILRKFSLDEFPQLYNVVRGEMSLVGPRPLPVDEVKRFNELAHRRRLSVRPGLTCLWQISGRSEVTDFRDWVRLDLEYIDNWSIWLDLKILCQTVPVVLTGAGAK